MPQQEQKPADMASADAAVRVEQEYYEIEQPVIDVVKVNIKLCVLSITI